MLPPSEQGPLEGNTRVVHQATPPPPPTMEDLVTGRPSSLAEMDSTAQAYMLEALKFASPLELARIFHLEGWSAHVEISELVKLARQDRFPNTKLAAILALRRILTDSLRAAGYIQEVRRRVTTGDASQPGGVQLSETRIHQLLAPQFPSAVRHGGEADAPAVQDDSA